MQNAKCKMQKESGADVNPHLHFEFCILNYMD
jgi:hypothetical protein